MGFDGAKYIIVEKNGIEVPVVFSDLLMHADVAKALGYTPISAGFCIITDDMYEAYGESFSLKLQSRRSQDAEILNKHLNKLNLLLKEQ